MYIFCAHTLITSPWCNLSLFPTTDPLSSPVSVSPACLSINFPFSQLTRLLPVSKHTPQQGSVDSHKIVPYSETDPGYFITYTKESQRHSWGYCRSKPPTHLTYAKRQETPISCLIWQIMYLPVDFVMWLRVANNNIDRGVATWWLGKITLGR